MCIFDDFWYVWGDVSEQIDYDNWILVNGIYYLSMCIEECNGKVWCLIQVFMVSIDGVMLVGKFEIVYVWFVGEIGGSCWEYLFDGMYFVVFVFGVDFYFGVWNIVLIKQDDGVVVFELLILVVYIVGLFDLVEWYYLGFLIKVVLIILDLWLYVVGVCEVVVWYLLVYVFDFNLFLLQCLVDVFYWVCLDDFQCQLVVFQWYIVVDCIVIGIGVQWIELYLLCGVDMGCQYMVYFFVFKLLYVSDILVFDLKFGVLYQFELMVEVVQVVDCVYLEVCMVFVMY